MCPALLCRLDAQDENHDHRVLGYTVYVGGQQRARVEGPLASQAELYGLDCTTDCHIQVWYVIDGACMHGSSCTTASLWYNNVCGVIIRQGS